MARAKREKYLADIGRRYYRWWRGIELMRLTRVKATPCGALIVPTNTKTPPFSFFLSLSHSSSTARFLLFSCLGSSLDERVSLLNFRWRKTKRNVFHFSEFFTAAFLQLCLISPEKRIARRIICRRVFQCRRLRIPPARRTPSPPSWLGPTRTPLPLLSTSLRTLGFLAINLCR